MSRNLVRHGALFGVLCLVAVLAALASGRPSDNPFHSVEVAVAEQSPAGATGGVVVPASCPSYSHSPFSTGLPCGDCPVGYQWVSYTYACSNGDVTYTCSSDQCEWSGCPPGYNQNGTTCERDYCPNLAGTQSSVPAGYTTDASGNCVASDVCPNIAGNQSSVPAGYTVDGSGNCQPTGVSNPIVTCTPSTVSEGGTTSCSWSCDTAHGDTASVGSGFPTGGTTSGTSGALTPSVPSTTYGVQCTPSGKRTDVVVSVNSPTLSISATPTRVRTNTASSISWSATNIAGSCTLTGTGINTSCSGSACASAHVTPTGALTQQSIFTLSCNSGAQRASATVNITPGTCEIGSPNCSN
jgi:hypothetical protein